MSDMLLGVIIGGAIAVVGSAVAALVQGYYSLRRNREEDASRQRQQSTQIEHDKSKDLICRIIEVRARYLYPLSDKLAELHCCIADCREELIRIIRAYIGEGYKAQIKEADKEGFMKQVDRINNALATITDSNLGIYRGTSKVTDGDLIKKLTVLVAESNLCDDYFREMRSALKGSPTGQEFTYDFETIMASLRKMSVGITKANARIESLLAGADAGAE